MNQTTVHELNGKEHAMNKKELRKLSKAELLDLLRMYGDESASASMLKEDLIESLINYDNVIHDLYPNDNEVTD